MANLLYAENVRYLREHNGLKQAEMLDELSYKQSTWNGYERGVSSPNLDDLIRISDYFGILESDMLHTQLAAYDINELYNRYIYRHNIKNDLGNAQRSAAFLSYYNSMDWALALAVNGEGKNAALLPASNKKKGKGLHYTNEAPAAAKEPTTKLSDSARIARLEGMISSMKGILDQFT